MAAVLLLAQAAGLAHRVAHGGALPAQVAALAATGAAQPHAHADGHGISGHEQAGAECRLFDQLLGHADLLPTSVLLGAVAHGTQAPAAAPQASPGSAPAAAYQARAPPLA